MSRIFNFSAGPAMLPAEVLSRAGDEILDWHGSGMSVMEMSHRGSEFIGIAADAERDLRELLAIPASYKVLFLAGGATLQFAQVPLNLLAQRAAPLMRDSGGGAIVNITSISGLRASTLRTAYGTSKAGLAHLTEEVGREEGCGLRALLLQRDHRRRRVPHAAAIAGAAGCGCFIAFPVATGRHREIRADLRRRAEERRSCGPDDRHRARRPDRKRRQAHAERDGLQEAGAGRVVRTVERFSETELAGHSSWQSRT